MLANDHLSENRTPEREVATNGIDASSAAALCAERFGKVSYLQSLIRASASTPNGYMPDYREGNPLDSMSQAIPASGIDQDSWRRLLMDDLFTETSGRVFWQSRSTGPVLPQDLVNFRLFRDPPSDPVEWASRQEAVMYVANNPDARRALEVLLRHLSAAEMHSVYGEIGEFLGGQAASTWYDAAVSSARNVTRTIESGVQLPAADEAALPSYVKALLETLKSTVTEKDGVIYLLAHNPAVSAQSLVAADRGAFYKFVRPFVRWLPATPFRHDPVRLATTALCLGMSLPFFVRGGVTEVNISNFIGGALGMTGFASVLFTLSSDPMTAPANALQARALKDPGLPVYFEALGRLQELVGMAQFIASAKTAICKSEALPASSGITFSAKGLQSIRNSDDASWIPNDLTLGVGAMAFLTGPNEGGKTELSLSIAGSYWTSRVFGVAAAERFSFSPVDILHVTPEGDSKHTTEFSRFRIEVEMMKEVIERITESKRPVLLLGDELFSSTNEGEAAVEAYKLFACLNSLALPPSVYIASHNRKLAALLSEARLIDAYQLAWSKGVPTYKLVPGIAESSHAADTVRRAGLATEDLERFFSSPAQAAGLSRFQSLLKRLGDDNPAQ